MQRNSLSSIPRALGSMSIAGLCLVAIGCGESGAPGRAQAQGTITLDGRPLEKGTVFFVDASGLPAGVGNIQGGSFEISENAGTKGVLPGDYRVKVESWKVEPGTLLDNGSFAKGESAIAKKYNDAGASGLKAEVKPGSNSFEFEVTSK